MSFADAVKTALGFSTEKKAVGLTDTAAFELFGSTPTVSGTNINSSSALTIPAVLQATRLISEAVGSLPCKLYRDAAESKEAAKDHPAYKLVHGRGNDWTSAGQLRVALTVDALLHGAGYAQVVPLADGSPFEMHRIDPRHVSYREEADGRPYYFVSVENSSQYRLEYHEMLHLRGFADASLVKLGREAIGVAAVLEKHAAQFFSSGARPSGIVSNEKPQGGEAGVQTVGKIIASWRKWKSNASGDPLILDAGWTFTSPVMNSTDAQFIENRLEQINEIGRIFGVPPSMLFQLERATWSNAEQMFDSFLALCLRPWLDKWQDAYATVLLTDEERDTLYFEFVVDDLQRTDAAARAEIFGKLISSRVMTPNEARSTMNLPALPDGDKLINPFTTSTSTTPAALPPAKEAA